MRLCLVLFTALEAQQVATSASLKPLVGTSSSDTLLESGFSVSLLDDVHLRLPAADGVRSTASLSG